MGLLGADIAACMGPAYSPPLSASPLLSCPARHAREWRGIGFVRVKMFMKTWFDLVFCLVFVVFCRVFVLYFFVVFPGQGGFLGRVLCMVFVRFCPAQATMSSVTFLVFMGFDLGFYLQ